MPLTEEQLRFIERTYHAPEGYTWVCLACGKMHVQRDAFSDVSCFLNSVLVENEQIILSEDNDERAAFVSTIAYNPRTDQIRA